MNHQTAIFHGEVEAEGEALTNARRSGGTRMGADSGKAALAQAIARPLRGNDSWVPIFKTFECPLQVYPSRREDDRFRHQPRRLPRMASRTSGQDIPVSGVRRYCSSRRAAYAAALEEQEKAVQAEPDSGPSLALLAYYQARLGRKEEALRNGRRAMELMPVEKDALDGVFLIRFFAATAARNEWNPIRDDPRFEKIVADLASKL